MTKLTLGQAAKLTGKHKTTLRKAIDRGDISASKNRFGHFEIDPSELTRVYPAVSNDPPDNTENSVLLDAEKQPINSDIDTIVKAKDDQIESLNKQHEIIRGLLENKVSSADKEIERLRELVERHQQTAEKAKIALAVERNKSFFQKLFKG